MTQVIGSISTGTQRPQDLIPTFLEELGERDTERYQSELEYIGASSPVDLPEDSNPWWSGDKPPEVLERLQEALNNTAPPYCYFGPHEGDNSDYGFWPDLEQAAEELPTFTDPGLLDEADSNAAVVVNDHGNMTLYSRDPSGEWQEVWAIV